MRFTKFLLFGLLIVHLELPERVKAQNAIWNGGTGDWFTTPSNWVCVSGAIASPCAPPNSNGASATIGTTFSNSPFSGAVGLSAPLSLNSLTVGNGVSGTLNISSASATATVNQLSVGAEGVLNISGEADFGNATTSNAGSIAVSGQNSLFSPASYSSTGTGTLQIRSGAQGSFFSVASMGGSGSSATVDGVGSTLSSVNSIVVGGVNNGERGSITIQNGGKGMSAYGEVGFFSGTTGAATVMGSGSVWTVGSTLSVGTHGGNGSLSILNGGSVSAGMSSLLSTSVGSGAGSVGSIAVGDGSTFYANGLTIGGQGGSGAVTVQNGGVVGVNGNEVQIEQNGTLELDSGSSFSAYPIFDLDTGGTLKLGIGSSSGYPNLAMENTFATLDGTIDFDFIDGFAPVAGETFELIAPTFANTNYNTAAFEVQGLASGFQYELLTQNGGLSLEALDNGVSTTATSGTPEPGSLRLIGVGLAVCGVMVAGRRVAAELTGKL